MRLAPFAFFAAFLVPACTAAPQEGTSANQTGPVALLPPKAAADTEANVLPPVKPPAPGTPGGFPGDRAPMREAPFAATSAQGAATVVQTYYALLEERRYDEAWRLWRDAGKANGMSRAAFAASFARYAEYHTQIGAPGEIEGAAGSLYVEVPVVVYGRLRNGAVFHMNGPVRLRRINDVSGATAAQRRWHIAEIGVQPSPAER